MNDTKAEIERVKAAIAKSKSPMFKRDNLKYLKKLEKRIENGGIKNE